MQFSSRHNKFTVTDSLKELFAARIVKMCPCLKYQDINTAKVLRDSYTIFCSIVKSICRKILAKSGKKTRYLNKSRSKSEVEEIWSNSFDNIRTMYFQVLGIRGFKHNIYLSQVEQNAKIKR